MTQDKRWERHVSRTAGSNYGRAALSGALDDMGDADERSNGLFRNAAAMGNLLASGELYEESYVVNVLLDIARARGMDERRAEKTIRRGLDRGRTTPRSAPAGGRLYNRNDAVVATCLWWEGVRSAEWTSRTSATDLRVLAALALISLRLGKVRFAASYREIAEEAGVCLKTAHASLKRIRRYVRLVSKGRRLRGDSSTWQLVRRDVRAKGNTLDSVPGEERLFLFARTPLNPDHDLWAGWSNGWRIYVLLLNAEALSVREIVDWTGRHSSTVRRIVNRLREQGLAHRNEEGFWTAALPPDGAVDGGFVRARRERLHKQQRELWARSRANLIEQKAAR